MLSCLSKNTMGSVVIYVSISISISISLVIAIEIAIGIVIVIGIAIAIAVMIEIYVAIIFAIAIVVAIGIGSDKGFHIILQGMCQYFNALICNLMQYLVVLIRSIFHDQTKHNLPAH